MVDYVELKDLRPGIKTYNKPGLKERLGNARVKVKNFVIKRKLIRKENAPARLARRAKFNKFAKKAGAKLRAYGNKQIKNARKVSKDTRTKPFDLWGKPPKGSGGGFW